MVGGDSWLWCCQSYALTTHHLPHPRLTSVAFPLFVHDHSLRVEQSYLRKIFFSKNWAMPEAQQRYWRIILILLFGIYIVLKEFLGEFIFKRITAVLQHLKQQVANGRDDNSADLRPLVAVVVQPDLWDRVQQCTCADLQPDLKQPWSWSRILQHLFSQTQKVDSDR